MNPICRVIIILLFTMGCFSACEKNEDNLKPKGWINKTSECKQFKNSESLQYTSFTSCVVYDYFSTTNVMKLWHYDGAFNCGMTKVKISVELSNDTLYIEETEEMEPANCLCLFDNEMQIRDLKSGKYVLYFKEPYVGNQQKLIFSVDLDKKPSGEYCVERDQYPWGN